MIALGHLPGNDRSSAQDVSDGGTVVGSSGSANGSRACLWTSANGMQPLDEVLANVYGLDLMGWTLYDASAISSDGRVIVGSGLDPDGNFAPWVAIVPEPATAILLGLGIIALGAARQR